MALPTCRAVRRVAPGIATLESGLSHVARRQLGSRHSPDAADGRDADCEYRTIRTIRTSGQSKLLPGARSPGQCFIRVGCSTPTRRFTDRFTLRGGAGRAYAELLGR